MRKFAGTMVKPKKKAAKKSEKRPTKYDKPFYLDASFDEAMGVMLNAAEPKKESGDNGRSKRK